MNKRWLHIAAVYCLIFSCRAYAGNVTQDSLDTMISNIVQKQIAEVQQHAETTEDQQAVQNEAGGFWKSNDFIFLSLLVSFGFNVYFYFIYLRRNLNTPQSAINTNADKLKKNIALMRNERIGAPKAEKLSDVRNKLRYSLWHKKLNENDITTNAKKLSISQGELMLASKLNNIGQSISKRA